MDNDRLEIDINSVRVLLSNYEQHKQRVRKHILDLYKELEDTDSFIEAVAMKKNILDGMPRQRGGMPKGIYEVVAQHDRLMETRISETIAGMKILIREEEALRRVWVCYQALDDEEYDVITRLYVMRQPYKQVETDLEYSHGKFEKLRREGLENILALYNSTLGYDELCTLSYAKTTAKSIIERECGKTN